jgi:hypothetical protein
VKKYSRATQKNMAATEEVRNLSATMDLDDYIDLKKSLSHPHDEWTMIEWHQAALLVLLKKLDLMSAYKVWWHWYQ